MKNITGWAAASLVVGILGACSVEVTEGSPDGGAGGSTSSTSSTSTGSAGSSTSSTSTTTTGSGGSGGSSGDAGSDASMCSLSASPSLCETCAFDTCKDETCACDGVADCKSARDAYFMCISGLDGGDMESCGNTFVTAAGLAGSGKANELASCMSDCENRCQGRD